MTMKKNIIYFAFAMLTAGTLTTACSSDDELTPDITEKPVQQANVTFTTTLAPKDTTTTRSINEKGVTAWEKDEKIAVYYETADGHAVTTATVTEVNNGVATITAVLTNAKNGGEAKFVYPATLIDETNGNIDASKLSKQHGTIEDISKNFDAATGSSTLVVSNNTCETKTKITMENQVVIGKFMPKFMGDAIGEIKKLTITDGSNTYTVTPESGTFNESGIYVAMLPVDDKEMIITAENASLKYGYGGKKISLAKGRIYNNLAIAMGRYVDLSTKTSNYTASGARFLTGRLLSHSVTITDGANVMLYNVTLSSPKNAPAINCKGSCTITLCGKNKVSADKGTTYPAIYAGPKGCTLTIKGCGKLDARADKAAVIGAGTSTGSCGNICIKGGDITVSKF